MERMRSNERESGTRQGARLRWWQQVLDQPAHADQATVFDEALRRRFQEGAGPDANWGSLQQQA